MTDLPHRGFTAFSTLLDRYHPQYMLHGHIHLNYGASIPREHTYGTTRIVNCFERVYLDVDAPVPKARYCLFAGPWVIGRGGHWSPARLPHGSRASNARPYIPNLLVTRRTISMHYKSPYSVPAPGVLRWRGCWPPMAAM